jgi:hypothetical protein
MNTPQHAPKPLNARELARDAAGLLGECLLTYQQDGEIAAVITTAIAEIDRIARRRRKSPKVSR